MKVLVTGSAGHLGEALQRSLRCEGIASVGTDLLPSPYTDLVGDISLREHAHACMDGIDVVMHTATLHKPHVVTHSKQSFVNANITGTLHLLEEAVVAGVSAFIFTSTTSTFGDSLSPPKGEPAAWINEDVRSIPKNIYGVTKVAAEDLCQLFARNHGLACIVLRTSRFFPEEDDKRSIREAYVDDNAKANEFLYRRVDVEDVVSAHMCAMRRAHDIGFGRYIVSATTPFLESDLAELRSDAPAVLERLYPAYKALYQQHGWKMFPSIDRVYVNQRARDELGWIPKYDFGSILNRLSRGEALRSPLAQAIAPKSYHDVIFAEGPYPVEDG